MKFDYQLESFDKKDATKINLGWILHNLPNPLLIAILILGIASSFEAVLNGYVLGQLIKTDLTNINNVTWLLLQAFFAFVFTYLSAYSFLLLKNQATKILNTKLKNTFFTYYFDDGVDEAVITNSVTSISKQIEQNYFSSVFMFLQTGISIVSTIIFILNTHFLLGTIYIALSFLSLIPTYLGKKQLDQKVNKWSHSNSTLINTISDTFKGRNEINSFGVKSLFFNRVNRLLNKEETNYRNLSNYQTTLMLYAWGFAVLTFLGPLVVGILLAQFSFLGITTSIIISLILTSDSVVGNIRGLTGLQNAIAGTRGIRTIKKASNSNKKTQKIVTNKDGLIIDNLTVTRDDKNVLNHLNLSLKNNDKILITGPSGVGKSTLLSAISGQVKIDSGDIYFNKEQITNSYYVFLTQSIWLFNDSIRDNLTLFQKFTDEQLIKVLKDVGLYDELGPSVLDYTIKNQGDNISGGQAQRLAIARGLLRDKKLFILDEITSSLDEKNALKIHDLIYQLPVTVIESAHNFSEKQLDHYQIKKFILSKNGLKQVDKFNNTH